MALGGPPGSELPERLFSKEKKDYDLEAKLITKKMGSDIIDIYCLCSGKGPFHILSEEEKSRIVEERIKYLNKKEWQRWTPLVGAYRVFKDLVKSDSILLNETHSNIYNAINMMYHLAIGALAFGIPVGHFLGD